MTAKPVTAQEIAVTTLADAIRERLIAYTPVRNPHQALVLAYTARMAAALAALDPGGAYGDIADAVDVAIHRAVVSGFSVPELPLGDAR